MIVAIAVRKRGPDGTVLASTTVAIDGSVVVALRPELLDAPKALQEHLDEVGQRVREWLGRIRRWEQVLSFGGRAARGGVAVCVVSAGLDLLHGAAMLDLAWWAAGVVACETARRSLPTLVRCQVRRWLARI